MKPISPETISQVIKELAESETISVALQDLDRHQPDVLQYLLLTMEGHPTEAGMRATQLGWCVYRAFCLEAGGRLPQLTLEEIVEKARLNSGLIEASGSQSLETFMGIIQMEMANQPQLLHFVRHCAGDVLTNDHEANCRLIHQVVAVFLSVKSVVDAFDAATDEPFLMPDRN